MAKKESVSKTFTLKYVVVCVGGIIDEWVTTDPEWLIVRMFAPMADWVSVNDADFLVWPEANESPFGE